MKHIIIAFIAIVVLLSPWAVKSFPNTVRYVSENYIKNASDFLASVIHKPVQIADMKSRYSEYSKKVNILIVPGHEPSFGGAEYSDLKERDMNVELSDSLAEFFTKNSHYNVIVSRDKQSWNKIFNDYFTNHWGEIVSFLNESKQDTLTSVQNGSLKLYDNGLYHNDAPKDVAYRLYGINKWGNENNIDIAIHVHFNDYPRKNTSVPGKYTGLTIYIPQSSYQNNATTVAVADTVFKRLTKYNAKSNLPKEDEGIVEDSDLIAIGAYNSSNAASMLIEYSYIYEPQFSDPVVREATLRELAYQTYLGVEDFFNPNNEKALAYDTLVLPYTWRNTLDVKSKDKNDVFALQTALTIDGVYPPSGKDKNDCPRTGKIGPCTAASIMEFQKKYGITGEGGVVGKKTLELLNSKYSVKQVN